MKRDMDLIREILMRVEDDPLFDGYHYTNFDTSDFPGHTDEEIGYHVDLLMEAGLVTGGDQTMDASSTPISRLTWNGHEFLDNVKDAGIWNQVKARVSTLPSIAFTVLAELAKAEVRKYLGLP